MTKQLILSVSCVNQYADDAPESFTAELTKGDMANIKRLAKAARELDVYSLDKFFYAGTWGNEYLDLDSAEIETEELEEVVNSIKSSEARVDTPMIRVTADSFAFIATPKHCGDDMLLTSRRVKLSELDAAGTHLSI